MRNLLGVRSTSERKNPETYRFGKRNEIVGGSTTVMRFDNNRCSSLNKLASQF